jgi:DNA/RNA-binding domain of Phe-tRNA-synthetase-like protein
VSEPAELQAAEGFVETQVREEFPGLRLYWMTLAARRRPSPPALVAQLDALSSRYRGGSVVMMRTRPIPQAYRAFYRQIGLDPDVDRIPSEEVAVTRLVQGGFRSVGLIEDACLVALIETGVPVWALDADAVAVGGLGIRTTGADERGPTTSGDAYLEPGSLVIADASAIHALLFREPLPGGRLRSRTRRVTLYAVAVDGVPAIHVEEALWICVDLLS